MPESQAPRLALRLPMQNRTSGGSSDSEVKALIVTPTGRPSSPTVVSTQTPEANRLRASRKARDSTRASALIGVCEWVADKAQAARS